jgi:hypothetical protein
MMLLFRRRMQDATSGVIASLNIDAESAVEPAKCNADDFPEPGPLHQRARVQCFPSDPTSPSQILSLLVPDCVDLLACMY